MKVKLSAIIDALEETDYEYEYFIDLQNGKIIQDSSFGSFYVDGSGEVDLEELIDYLKLPTKYEMNEYQIIKKFISTIKDEQIRNQFFITIQGPGAFRRFKDSCINYNLINDWYAFQKEAYYDIAKDYCIWNNVSYIDDIKK